MGQHTLSVDTTVLRRMQCTQGDPPTLRSVEVWARDAHSLDHGLFMLIIWLDHWSECWMTFSIFSSCDSRKPYLLHGQPYLLRHLSHLQGVCSRILPHPHTEIYGCSIPASCMWNPWVWKVSPRYPWIPFPTDTVFSILSWLNLHMWNPRIWRADCTSLCKEKSLRWGEKKAKWSANICGQHFRWLCFQVFFCSSATCHCDKPL